MWEMGYCSSSTLPIRFIRLERIYKTDKDKSQTIKKKNDEFITFLVSVK